MFYAKFGRSRISRTASMHNSFIVLRCMWKEPAPLLGSPATPLHVWFTFESHIMKCAFNKVNRVQQTLFLAMSQMSASQEQNTSRRVTKTPLARQQCWPESFCNSGKFLRQVHYWLKNFRILCKTIYPDNMESVRMNWKKSLDKFPDDPKSVQLILKMCPDNLKRVWMMWKVSVRSKQCPDNLKNVSR